MQVLEGNITHEEGAKSVHLDGVALFLFRQIDSMSQ